MSKVTIRQLKQRKRHWQGSASVFALLFLAGCSSALPKGWMDDISGERSYNTTSGSRRPPALNPPSAYGMSAPVHEIAPPPPPPPPPSPPPEVKPAPTSFFPEPEQQAPTPVEEEKPQVKLEPKQPENYDAHETFDVGQALDRWFGWIELPSVDSRKPIPGNPNYSMKTEETVIDTPLEAKPLPPVNLTPSEPAPAVAPVEEKAPSWEPSAEIKPVRKHFPGNVAVSAPKEESKPHSTIGKLQPDQILRLPDEPKAAPQEPDHEKMLVVMSRVAYETAEEASHYPKLESVPERPAQFERIGRESAQSLEQMQQEHSTATAYKSFIESGPDPLLTGGANTPPAPVSEPAPEQAAPPAMAEIPPPPVEAVAPPPEALPPQQAELPAPPPQPVVVEAPSPPPPAQVVAIPPQAPVAAPAPVFMPVAPAPVAQAAAPPPPPSLPPQTLAPSHARPYIVGASGALPESRYTQRRVSGYSRQRLSNN